MNLIGIAALILKDFSKFLNYVWQRKKSKFFHPFHYFTFLPPDFDSSNSQLDWDLKPAWMILLVLEILLWGELQTAVWQQCVLFWLWNQISHSVVRALLSFLLLCRPLVECCLTHTCNPAFTHTYSINAHSHWLGQTDKCTGIDFLRNAASSEYATY